jgi:hypothetical protein
MLQHTQNIYTNGKKSLDTLLREQSFKEVQQVLEDKGIDINSVADENIEKLVAARVNDKKKGIKGFAKGAAFALILSLVTGGI